MSGESLDDHYVQQRKNTSSKHKPVEEPTKNDAEIIDTIHYAEIDVLKAFDLNNNFGPCYGIGRLERWLRAEELGLNPPERVRQLIENHPSDTSYTESLWHDTILSTH